MGCGSVGEAKGGARLKRLDFLFPQCGGASGKSSAASCKMYRGSAQHRQRRKADRRVLWEVVSRVVREEEVHRVWSRLSNEKEP